MISVYFLIYFIKTTSGLNIFNFYLFAFKYDLLTCFNINSFFFFFVKVFQHTFATNNKREKIHS